MLNTQIICIGDVNILFDLQVIQYREQSDLAFMLLIKSQHLEEPINLDELMRYSLTPVPHSLGTADGYFNKTNKATLLHFLMEDDPAEVPYPKDAFYIQDGNALFHALMNLSPTFGDICLQVLDQMMSKKNFVFSTDSYHADSIKSQERLRRGYSQRYLIDGPATRKPSDFKLFLANEQNKTQLCQLLLRVWGSKAAVSRIEKIGTAVAVVEGKAYQLESTGGEVSILSFNSHNSDTSSPTLFIIIHTHSVGLYVIITPKCPCFR